MRNLVRTISMMFLTLLMFACSSDDESQKSTLQNDYFDVENSEFKEGNLPVGKNDEMIQSASFDKNALPGGSSYLEINSTEELDYLNVAVKGISGYLQVKLDNPEKLMATARSNGILRYTVIVLISQNLSDDFTLEYTIVNKKGDVSKIFTSEVEYIKAGTGLLQVNLRFSNEKDIDLHVEEPNGNHISYFYPFPYLSEEYKKFNEWIEDENYDEDSFLELIGRVGLDIDSNAGCDIDGLNSENIFFEEDCMQKGTYKVYVNMFDNCDPSIATNYTIRVIYKGKEIATKEGRFEINTIGNSDDEEFDNLTKVLEFKIDEGLKASVSRSVMSESNKGLMKGEFNMLIK